MGPHPHQALNLKNAQGNVVVCGLDDLAIAGEHGLHWGRGKRSFGHGGCKGSGRSEEQEGGIARGPSIILYSRSYVEKKWP
jgi:hypothetical protein